MVTLNVGDRVGHLESDGVSKVGNVVEIGTGENAGRIRVLWEYRRAAMRSVRKHGNRTWIKATVLVINPVEFTSW